MTNNGFKDLCATLLNCAEKFEQEMKINLNELNNLAFNGHMSEVKISLEKAKDFHYKEILGSIQEIFKQIKVILVHDDKIRWLSDEDHFTKEELRRYSNSQNSQSCMDLSKEPHDEPIFINIKREKRRVASEISIGTLEAWEKYLDQKKEEEKLETEPVIKENIKKVPKRANPDFRRRKKFVSSTLGGFLEDDPRQTQLNAIPEDFIINEENEAFSSCEELHNISLLSLNNFEHHVNTFNAGDSTIFNNNNEKKEETNKQERNPFENDKPRIVDVVYKKTST